MEVPIVEVEVAIMEERVLKIARVKVKKFKLDLISFIRFILILIDMIYMALNALNESVNGTFAIYAS